MHEGDVKPFEEMSREELIAAATFWRGEYERVTTATQYTGSWQLSPTAAVPQVQSVTFVDCPKCGRMHNVALPCLVRGRSTTFTVTEVRPLE